MYDAFDAALLSDGTLDVAWTSDYQGEPRHHGIHGRLLLL